MTEDTSNRHDDGTTEAEEDTHRESTEPDLSVDEVFQKDGSNHSQRGASSGSFSGSWGYASVERRLDLNASLDLDRQQGRLKRMLKSIGEGLEPKEGGASDEKKDMEDISEMDHSEMDQSSGDNNKKEGGGFRVPKTLRHLHKKKEKLQGIVDEFEEEITKIFHKIGKLTTKVQGVKDDIEFRSTSEEYSISFALTGKLETATEEVSKIKKKQKKDRYIDNDSVVSAESEITKKASNHKKKKTLTDDGAETTDAATESNYQADEDSDDFFDWKKWRWRLKKKTKRSKSKVKGKAKKGNFFDWKRYRKAPLRKKSRNNGKSKFKNNSRKGDAPPPAPAPPKIPKAKWWVRMCASNAAGWK
jgi:hypothetical protein